MSRRGVQVLQRTRRLNQPVTVGSISFSTGVEYVGNKLPEPFTIFLILFLITGVASSIMAWMDIKVQVPGSDEIQPVKGLFTGEGMSWFTTTMGENYINFPPLVTVLPIMLAVGVAERSGMLSALIRKLFGSAKPWLLPYAVGVIGVTASVMADAAFVIVPPLAAMVFKAASTVTLSQASSVASLPLALATPPRWSRPPWMRCSQVLPPRLWRPSRAWSSLT